MKLASFVRRNRGFNVTTNNLSPVTCGPVELAWILWVLYQSHNAPVCGQEGRVGGTRRYASLDPLKDLDLLIDAAHL